MLLLLLFALAFDASPSSAFLWKSKPQFAQPKHAEGVVVADYARHDLPPVLYGGRVVQLMSGLHFDAMLQDTPDELRPPSVILFNGFETCPGADEALQFTKMAETQLPSRERLLVASYDMDANPKRSWFKFTPEMDLAKRFNATKCGSVVYVPRKCDGFTKYCTKPTNDPMVTKVGCEDFEDKCAPLVTWFDGKRNLLEWITEQMSKESEPEISPVFGSYAEQRRWLLQRDDTTTDNEFRNYFLVESFPAFTPLGFKAMPIPEKMQQWLMDFWNRKKHGRVREGWTAGSTQMNFHEEPTTFVSLDQERAMRDKLANEIIKPLVEQWSGINNLELTSFYGIREYKAGKSEKSGSFLKSHIDRIDTHVLSVTFTLAKVNSSNINQVLPEGKEGKPWPLEVVAFDGDIYRHVHPAGTMILYESSKLAHGRPYHIGLNSSDHLGCFCHFKPVSNDKQSAEKWDLIARDARANQQRNTKRIEHRSTAVVEPKNPVFSKNEYGDGTGWNDEEDEDEDERVKRFTVQFVNAHDVPLDLYWLGGQENVFQGSLAPGAKLEMNTFVGHKFSWAEQGTETFMPRGKFEIELGSRVYRYGNLVAETS